MILGTPSTNKRRPVLCRAAFFVCGQLFEGRAGIMAATVKARGIDEGLTVTGRVFADGNAAAVETGLAFTYSGTENNAGTFAAETTTGLCYLELVDGSGVLRWSGWAVLVAGSTVEASSERALALSGYAAAQAEPDADDEPVGNELQQAIQTRANITKKLLELSRTHTVNVSINGNSYNLADYRRQLREELQAINEIIAMLSGPIEFISEVTT